MDGFFRVDTIDGYRLKLVITALTNTRIQTSKEKAIRDIMRDVVNEKVKTLDFGQIVHEVVLGKLASDVYNEARKVTAIRHIGVRKSELLGMPS